MKNRIQRTIRCRANAAAASLVLACDAPATLPAVASPASDNGPIQLHFFQADLAGKPTTTGLVVVGISPSV